MRQFRRTFQIRNVEETARLAQRIGDSVNPGDTVLLTGQVGAGKTFFARALLQHILIVPEDVPSPTFTLVQTYETRRGPVWHCDLYRLTSAFELEELGLHEAFETAICLIEWPEILGEDAPQDALHLDFAVTATDDTRTITAWSADARWAAIEEVAQQK